MFRWAPSVHQQTCTRPAPAILLMADACVGSRCPCRCEGVRAARMHRWKVMVEDWVDGSTLGGEPLDPPRFYALAMRAPQTMAQARCVSVRTLQRSDAEQFESSYAPATEIVAGSACGGAGTARDRGGSDACPSSIAWEQEHMLVRAEEPRSRAE